MDRGKIATAVAEARRFIERAEALPAPRTYTHGNDPFVFTDNNNPRESGALRRASMDLTRALADMRRPA